MPKAIIFSGAGASAPSGIPTFRGAGGIYNSSRIHMYVDINARKASRSIMREAIARYVVRSAYIASRGPNDYHTTLVSRLRKDLGVNPSRDLLIYTQNVDDLHEAGLISLDVQNAYSRVYHVHGRIRVRRKGDAHKELRTRRKDGVSFSANLGDLEIVRKIYERIVADRDKERVALDVITGRKDPISGISLLLDGGLNELSRAIGRRPDVVLYGERVPYPNVSEDLKGLKIDGETLYLIVLGTSLVVFPAAFIPVEVVERAYERVKEIRILIVAGDDHEEVRERLEAMINGKDKVLIDSIRASDDVSSTVSEIINRLRRIYALIRIILRFKALLHSYMEVLFKVRRIERETIKRISGTSEKRASLLRRLPYNSFVFSAAFDGLRLAYGGRGGKIEVYEVFDPEDPEKMYTLNAHSGSVMDLLRVEGKLFSCSRDATIKIRDGEKLVRTLKGHDQCVRSIAYRDGNLVSVSMDGRILLRDLSTGNYKELKRHGKRVVHVRNHEDVFACVSIDGYLWVFERDKELFSMVVEATGYGVSINRPYVAVSHLKGVTIVDAEAQEIVKRIDLPATDTYIRRLSHIRDAIGVGGEFLYIIDDPLNKAIISPLAGHKHRIYNVVFEDFAFTCSLDKTLGIRRIERLIQTVTESEREGVKTLAFRCSKPGEEEPPERLVRMFKKRPVKALKIACGKYLKRLIERLEGEGLIVDGVSQVPPEDPESLEEVERVFL